MSKSHMSSRSILQRSVGVVCLAAVLATAPRQAEAVEYALPYLAGAVIGLPTALPLPPGLYFTAGGIAQLTSLKNGQGKSAGVDIDLYRVTFAAIYVAETKILGATYSAFIRDTVAELNYTQGGVTSRRLGLFNAVVSPIQLTWNLGGPFFFALGQDFVLNTGTYSKDSPINVSNNFTTFETVAALTYFTPEFTASLTAFYDTSTINDKSNSLLSQTGRYQSGDVLTLDFSATWQLGPVGIGAGGYYLVQTTDDKADGRVVPATPFNGRGSRAESFALGPTVSYSLGPVQLAVYYTRDVFTRNYIGGDTIWTRIAAKF